MLGDSEDGQKLRGCVVDDVSTGGGEVRTELGRQVGVREGRGERKG